MAEINATVLVDQTGKRLKIGAEHEGFVVPYAYDAQGAVYTDVAVSEIRNAIAQKRPVYATLNGVTYSLHHVTADYIAFCGGSLTDENGENTLSFIKHTT